MSKRRTKTTTNACGDLKTSRTPILTLPLFHFQGWPISESRGLASLGLSRLHLHAPASWNPCLPLPPPPNWSHQTWLVPCICSLPDGYKVLDRMLVWSNHPLPKTDGQLTLAPPKAHRLSVVCLSLVHQIHLCHDPRIPCLWCSPPPPQGPRALPSPWKASFILRQLNPISPSALSQNRFPNTMVPKPSSSQGHSQCLPSPSVFLWLPCLPPLSFSTCVWDYVVAGPWTLSSKRVRTMPGPPSPVQIHWAQARAWHMVGAW